MTNLRANLDEKDSFEASLRAKKDRRKGKSQTGSTLGKDVASITS